jgi:hypothetical protein
MLKEGLLLIAICRFAAQMRACPSASSTCVEPE